LRGALTPAACALRLCAAAPYGAMPLQLQWHDALLASSAYARAAAISADACPSPLASAVAAPSQYDSRLASPRF
jgi:hypothetical protein